MATRGSIPKIMEMAGVEMLPPEAGVAWIRRELSSSADRGEVVVAGALGRMAAGYHPTGGLDPVDRSTRRGPHWSVRSSAPTCSTASSSGPRSTRRRSRSSTTTASTARRCSLASWAWSCSPRPPGCSCRSGSSPPSRTWTSRSPVKFYRDEPRTLTVTARLRPDDEPTWSPTAGSRPSGCCPGATRRSGPSTSPDRCGSPPEPLAAGRARWTPTDRRPSRERTMLARPTIYRLYFHGPAFQVVGAGMARSDGAAAGRLAERPAARPRAAAAGATSSRPRLEELCFQVAGLWEAGHEGRLALPAHVDRLTVVGTRRRTPSRLVPVAVARPQDDTASTTAQVDRARTARCCSGSRATAPSRCLCRWRTTSARHCDPRRTARHERVTVERP